MKKMLLASNNVGKQREIQSLLDDLDIELITPDNLGLHLEVLEDGITYAENAARKAMAFARASGMVALADNSGLEVDALGGAPGLHSARYSPITGATDADRRTFLLQQLQSHPRPWPARFRCFVALANPAGQVWFADGECPGEIIPEERGHNGFGYDPIFLLPDLGLTMAELTLEQKNHLSHRARAVTAARPVLLKLSSPAPH